MGKIYVIGIVVLVWIVAFVGIRVMKKIQPNDKIYPVWAVIIAILFTAFVAWHEFWVLKFLGSLKP